MAVVRATLDNSSECWSDYVKRCVGINDLRIQSNTGYKLYTWDEVVKHDKVNDCWLVIHGKVYDVTKWVPQHPGGKIIYDGAGGDSTGVWESYHPQSLLTKGVPSTYLIGEVRDYKDFYSWDGEFYKTVKERVEAAIPRHKRRNDPQMTNKCILLLVLYFISLFLYIYYCTWWSAIFWGLLCSQLGVNIMHDGNHMAFTSSKSLSWAAGHALDLIGSSSVVYRRSHTFGHHSCVNHYELDRSFDTTFPLMRLHMSQPLHWYHMGALL